MNKQTFLLLFNEDPIFWAERFQIEAFEVNCKDCKEILKTTIPFFTKEFRGLISPKCICGNNDTPYCLVKAPGFTEFFMDKEVGTSKKKACLKKRHQACHSLKLLDNFCG